MSGARVRPWARIATTLLGLATIAAASAREARAQVIVGDSDRYQSPQHFALELRFGPYKPDVDSEFGGARSPYQDFFGANRRLMSQIELDYEIIRHVGTAGLVLSVGYFSASGSNRDVFGALTGDKSTLKLIPLSLSLVYRFDLAYERYKIPLVPYGKLGFDYTIWSINNGNGEVPQYAGGTGHGGTLGWHAAVGLSLVLDFIDPSAARSFDSESGVNHTYAFVELGHWDVSGLGGANRLHVGDNTWVAGLMFEF